MTSSVLPQHLAFIMDGNNRWAKKRNLPASAGHRQGVTALRRTIKRCGELGIRIVTVFAFSNENWQRDKSEVDHLMKLFFETLENSLTDFVKEGMILRVIGNRSKLDPNLVGLIESAEEATQGGKYTLIVALDYGGRQDIVAAAQKLATQVQQGAMTPADITLESFNAHLATAGLPPPDLCIRTSNEQRISNFMLWQLAYTELYFCPSLWPDFDSPQLEAALADYANRQRRFGLRGQLKEAVRPNVSKVKNLA